MEPLRIRLLGGFLLEHEGRSLPPIASRIGRSLLAYLVTYRHRAHTRDLLAGTFWPEMPESRARKRLSQALWQVQGVLSELPIPESFLRTTANSVQFNSAGPYWLDVEEFEQAAETSATPIDTLTKAVDLYRGDFLAGFYEEWLLPEQDRLRAHYLAILGHLIQQLKGRSEYERALSFAKRIVVQDPLHEESHREVMRLCFLAGRPHEALQQYERCVSILEEEMGVSPSRETIELRSTIEEAQAKGERPFAPAPTAPLFGNPNGIDLVGRTAERAAILERLEDALAGRGGIVLLEGEAGVGKSRLLHSLNEDAHWRGLSALWGSGTEIGIGIPYGLIAEAVISGMSPLRAKQLSEMMDPVWLSTVGRVIPTLGDWLPTLPPGPPLRPEEEPTRMREAFVRVISHLGKITPLVVFLDDVQWSDEDTLDCLGMLAQFVMGSQITMILSYRSAEARDRGAVWDTLLDLDRVPGTERVQLTDLSPLELSQLVEQSMGWNGVRGEFIDSLHHQTGGNPLLALETLRAMQERSGSNEDEGERLPSLPTGVTTVLARRVGAVPPSTRSVLESVAVFERPVNSDQLIAATDASALEVLSALDDGLRRALLVENLGSYRFHHEQLRRVVLAEMDEASLTATHFRVGEWLTCNDPSRVEEMSYHFGRARAWDRAFRYHRLAGERARSVGAFQAAAEHFAEAADILDRDPEAADRAELWPVLTALEESLDVLGRPAEQASVIGRLTAEAGKDRKAVAEAARRRAWLFARTDRFDEAAAAAAVALEGASQRAPALIVHGQILIWRGSVLEAVPWFREAVEAAMGTASEADARQALGAALASLGDPEAEPELRIARDQHEEAGNPRGVAEALGLLATVYASQGDYRRAESSFTAALDVCRRIGYRPGEAVNGSNLATLLFLANRPVAALARYDAAADIFGILGNERGRAFTLVNSAWVRHRALGDDERAGRDAASALDYFERVGNRRGSALCGDVLAGITSRRGDLDGAARQARAALSRFEDIGDPWLTAQSGRTLAEIELARGNLADALEAGEEALRACRLAGLEALATGLQATVARILAAAGRIDEARQFVGSARRDMSTETEQSYLIELAAYEVLKAAGAGNEAELALDRAYEGLQGVLEDLDPVGRRRAIEGVPDHLAICRAWQQRRPRTVVISLPGRAGDRVEVSLTAEDPGDLTLRAGVDRRRRQLARMLTQMDSAGAITVPATLAEILEVSVATVRRDLKALRR